jgi:hypothetical protein
LHSDEGYTFNLWKNNVDTGNDPPREYLYRGKGSIIVTAASTDVNVVIQGYPTGTVYLIFYQMGENSMKPTILNLIAGQLVNWFI